MDISMNTLFITLIVILFICVISSNFFGKVKDKGTVYERAETLFTPAERSLLGILERLDSESFTILGKVRVADILKPSVTLKNKKGEWQRAFNKISSKHFDFVICDKNTLNVLCVVELDDKSHNSKKVKLRDKFLNQACADAKLPMVRIKAAKSYKIDQIKEAVDSSLEGTIS